MLNQKAIAVYEYIKERISNDYSPTVREICADLDLKSTSTAFSYINELCEHGLIEKHGNKNRSLSLPANSAVVPILGTVAAGTPILAYEDIQGYVSCCNYKGSINDLFALRIKGESMINVGILDGDIVIAKKTAVAENGAIAVCMVDEEATVKRFFKENGHYRLQPENDDFNPIIVDHVTILGVLVSCVRYY
ncbi:MAG: transcriptional repressor LexA [Oscillospiraceae bacterium]